MYFRMSVINKYTLGTRKRALANVYNKQVDATSNINKIIRLVK